MLQTEILGKYNLSPFDDQYFLTSKTELYLKDLRTASDMPPGPPAPPGVCQTQSTSKSSSFLSSSRMGKEAPFRRPDLHKIKYQFLEEKHRLLGRIKKQWAEKISCFFFFIYSYSLKIGKREGQCIQSGMQRKATF